MNAERERKEKKQNYKTSLEEEIDDDDDDGVYYFKLLFIMCVFLGSYGFFNSLMILQLFDCFATQSMLCSSLSHKCFSE